jgi:hypothetical protein
LSETNPDSVCMKLIKKPYTITYESYGTTINTYDHKFSTLSTFWNPSFRSLFVGRVDRTAFKL